METCQPAESITAMCKPKNSGADDAGKSSDGLNPERKMDDSHLVDVAVTGDSVNEIKAVEMSSVKRKRGRPPKNQARIMSSSSGEAPQPRRKKEEDEEEDVCFICFDGGSLVLCDRHGCPKAYHPACIKRDEAFFKSKAKWNCGWHICSTCQKASYYMCYTCTYSLCKNCTKDADYVNVRGNKGFCGLCLKTIMLIENSTLGEKEMVQVDFDDKTSWEYLFKVYWILLKEKLSLSVDELTKAKNPWKENVVGDLGPSFSKRRKMLKQNTFLNNVQSVEAGKPGITASRSRPTNVISKGSDAVATQLAVLGNSDGPPIIERCKTDKKVDDKGQKANPDEFAAIDVHNMNLIYLKRNLMENLIDDADKFYNKVVGSLVRIKIPGCDQKQDTYRLVKVVGTMKVAEPYKIGEKTIYVMIEILNLDKKEAVSIDRISNQEFSEDECQQLRQSIIKSGQIKWFTVGEIQEKAMALQAVRVNDWLESEISRVKDLRGKANEKGDMKELRECEEKLQLLNSPDERHRRLHEIPDIHRDPNRNLFCKSEEVSGELDEKKKGMELSVNNIETDKIWHYQDPLGKIQGPFPMAMLRGWSNNGHFPSDLRIWRVSDKQDDSILLTDALVGRYNQAQAAQQLFHNIGMPTEDVSIAPEDGYQNRDGDIRESRDPQVNRMESKQVEGSLNPMQNDTSGHCNGHNESAKSKELGSQSSTYTASVDIVDPNAAQTGSPLPHRDSTKGDIYVPGQPQVSSSLPTSMLSGKPCETQSHQVSKGHGIEKRECGLIDMNVNLNKTSEGQTINGNVKQDDTDGKSGKSSGECWRAPPLNDASNEWDSNSGLLYLARALEVSEHNQDIDFPDLPTSTSKLHHEDSKGQATKNKQSVSSNVPHLDSGPSWSNASTLVGNAVQIPGVAGEWGGYTSNSARPSVGEWNPELVPKSSMKPTDLGSDHAATPTSGSCQLTHSSPIGPANNESGWDSIVPEPNEYSLGDESVSDLLAEVEAMESLNGLASPTSILRGDGDLAQGSEPDCFSPVSGLSPAHDPGENDTLPSLLALTNELFGITKSEDAQKSSGGHSSTSAEMDEDTRPSDASVNQYEAGSDKQPRQPPATTWSMATIGTAWSAGPETMATDWGAVQANGNFHWEGLGQGTTNISWETDQGKIQENRSSIHSGTSTGNPAYFGSQRRHVDPRDQQRHADPRDQQRHVDPRDQQRHVDPKDQQRHVDPRDKQRHVDPRDQQRHVDPRDQQRHVDPRDRDSRGRDSSSGRDRTSWNRHSSSYGGGPPNRVGSLRPPPKGQRVCKFYESGYCNRGASCSYWHP